MPQSATGQLALDWSATPPPFRAGSHASWTGARAVVETWPARVSAYLQVLRNAGSLNDYEAASVLRWPVSSVNSVRGWLRDYRDATGTGPEIAKEGFDEHRFIDAAGKERVTRRTRWRLVTGKGTPS